MFVRVELVAGRLQGNMVGKVLCCTEGEILKYK
jgi:hypothetical protein